MPRPNISRVKEPSTQSGDLWVYQARESTKGLSRGHYPKAWLQSPAAAHPQALDIVTAFSLQQNELPFSQK